MSCLHVYTFGNRCTSVRPDVTGGDRVPSTNRGVDRYPLVLQRTVFDVDVGQVRVEYEVRLTFGTLFHKVSVPLQCLLSGFDIWTMFRSGLVRFSLQWLIIDSRYSRPLIQWLIQWLYRSSCAVVCSVYRAWGIYKYLLETTFDYLFVDGRIYSFTKQIPFLSLTNLMMGRESKFVVYLCA